MYTAGFCMCLALALEFDEPSTVPEAAAGRSRLDG